MLTREQAIAVVKRVRGETAEYRADLPTFTRDVRESAIVALALATDLDRFYSLPFYWQRSVSMTLLALRIGRAFPDPECRRGEIVQEFCKYFIEDLWHKYSRRTVGFVSQPPCTTNTNLRMEQVYDMIWSILIAWGYCE